MDEFLTPILLKEEFVFDGTIEQLNEKIRLNNNKKFKTEWSEYNRFKFTAKWSLGTLIIDGFPKATDGIGGFAELKKISDIKTKVELRTKIRSELYFVIILVPLVYIVAIVSKQEFSNWTLLYFPLILLWFWFVYRVQEKMLFKKVKDYLTN